MNIEELKKIFLNRFPNLNENDLEVFYHSSSLFPLYRVSFKKSIQVKDRYFTEFAIKIIQNRDMAFSEFEDLSILYNFNVRVPFPIDVLEINNQFLLVMEFVQKGSMTQSSKKDLVNSLKKLYGHRGLSFGLDKDNFIGTLIQKNSEFRTFFDFWWNSRIEPMMDLAIQGKYFSKNDKENLYKIIKNFLLEWNLEKDQPRAIHGDLWSGNILYSDQYAYLIDPSFAYSHPVQDFAMLELFGSPLNFSDYQEIANYCNFKILPEMIEFFQIYPLLVHVNIFGHSYKRGILNFIQRNK